MTANVPQSWITADNAHTITVYLPDFIEVGDKKYFRDPDLAKKYGGEVMTEAMRKKEKFGEV